MQVVDRWFNPARYGADRSFAAFAARIKDAIDQVAVRDDLLGTVNRALEPAEAWIWTAGASHRNDLGTAARESALSSSLADLGENP